MLEKFVAFDIEIAKPLPYFPSSLENYAPWVAKHGLLAPYGECQCGCGERTNRSVQTSMRRGMREGDPQRFLVGHSGGRKGWTIQRRFWSKVKKTDNCWEWQGCKQSQGYGQIRIDGKALLAHRVSWEIENGSIPDEKFVLHKCDNPPCVRPSHLFIGDAQDNADDMVEKGRKNSLYGELAGSAKLTNQQANQIRTLCNFGMSSRQIATRFGVSHTTVLEIVRNHRYSEEIHG